MPVRDLLAMLGAMNPELSSSRYVFYITPSDELVSRALPEVWALVREEEGHTLVLPLERAEDLGLDGALPMRRITLKVHSSLEGVGLTAAVARTLAGADIPCNVVAGFHHDHLFVPDARAEEALVLLRGLQRSSRFGRA